MSVSLDRERPDASDFHDPAGGLASLRVRIEHVMRAVLKSVDKGHDCFPGKGWTEGVGLSIACERWRWQAALALPSLSLHTKRLYTIWTNAACRCAGKSGVGQAIEAGKAHGEESSASLWRNCGRPPPLRYGDRPQVAFLQPMARPLASNATPQTARAHLITARRGLHGRSLGKGSGPRGNWSGRRTVVRGTNLSEPHLDINCATSSPGSALPGCISMNRSIGFNGR